jgi:hypothetical protein
MSPPATNPMTTGSESGKVSLVGTIVTVQGGGMALVKLDCTGSMTCDGKLTLTVEAKGKKKRTSTIGTVSFSISRDETKAVKIKLDATGRALLDTGCGRLKALAILKLALGSAQTQSNSVQLVQKTHGTRRVKKK